MKYQLAANKVAAPGQAAAGIKPTQQSQLQVSPKIQEYVRRIQNGESKEYIMREMPTGWRNALEQALQTAGIQSQPQQSQPQQSQLQQSQLQQSQLQQSNPQIMELINKITPNGDKLKYIFTTGQGSQYIMTEKGMIRRNKSVHANSEGDEGVHGWKNKTIFVPPQYAIVGNAAQFLSYHKFNFTLNISNDKANYIVTDPRSNQWRPATWADAFPNSVKSGKASANQVLEFTYTKQPTIGYNILDANNSGGKINGIHFGSPVTDVRPIMNATIQDLQPFVHAK